MLNVWYGKAKGRKFIAAPNIRFNTSADPKWILGDVEREMIRDIDHSEVISENLVISDMRGAIPPRDISGGVKALILAKNMRDYVVNATASGNNCAKWYLELSKDEDLTICLDYLMKFPEPFEIRIMNTGDIVTTQTEYVYTLAKLPPNIEIDFDKVLGV